MGRRVRKFDGPSGRGLWYRLWGRRAARVQKVQRVRPAFGRLAQRVADCPSGNAYKVSVTGFTFSIIWQNKHYDDQPPPVAFPPLVPYGTTFPPRWEACHLILSRLRLPANQVPLPPRSGQGGGHYPSGARLAYFPSPARAVVKVLIYNGAEGAVPRQRSDTI